ncbi:MAG: RNA helicase [Guiyang dicistrovirus 2]|nr:MAG: RNA helicase [Guiyang dicistrovirus 2]
MMSSYKNNTTCRPISRKNVDETAYSQMDNSSVNDLVNDFTKLQVKHPGVSRNNEPRVHRLENALQRMTEKYKSTKKQLRRAKGNQRIYTQMMSELSLETQFSRLTGIFGDKIETQMFGNTINEVKNISFDLGIRADNLNANLSKICDVVENLLPTISNNIKQTTVFAVDGFTTIKDDAIKMSLLTTVVALLMSLQKHRLALAITLVFIVRYYRIDEQIYTYVREIISQLSRNRPQSFWEETLTHPIFILCGKIIFSALSFFLIKKIPGKQDMDSFLLRLDRVPKAAQGGKKIFDNCSEVFEAARSQVYTMLFDKELHRVDDTLPKIKTWISNVHSCLDLVNRNKIGQDDIEFIQKCENLYQEGVKYQSDTLLDRETQRLITATLVPARDMYQYVASTVVKGGGPRMRPICLWLVGESGIGKTELIYPLCIDVLRTMGLIKPSDYQHQIYARQVETEYWDGYKGQKIVIYDDAFQKKDDKTQSNPEVFEVIRSCNTFPQHLHMAALQDKNTYSSAELMIYTTNEMNVDLPSLTFPEAFHNRMGECAFRVQPKIEHAIVTFDQGGNEHRRLDKTTLNKEVAIDLSIYEFQRMIKTGGDGLAVIWQEEGEPIDFPAFSKLVCDMWKQKRNDANRKQKFLENYAIRTQMCEEFHDCLDTMSIEEEISTRLHNGEELLDIVSSWAVDPEKYARYCDWKDKQKKPSKWEKYLDRMRIIQEQTVSYIQLIKEKVGSVLKKYPLYSFLSFIGLAISAIGVYKYFQQDEPILAEVASSGDANTSKMQKKIVEVASSGDSSTLRNGKRFVEVASSGDSNTAKSTKVQVEVASSGDVNTRKNSKVNVEMTLEQIQAQEAYTQGCSDEVAHALVTDLLQKNTYRLSYERNGMRYPFGNTTFLHGWVCVMPKHFIEGMFARKLTPETTIDFSQAGLLNIMRVPVSHFLKGKMEGGYELTENVVQLGYKDGAKRDCVLVNLHKQMCQPHRSLLKNLITKEDQGLLKGKFCGTLATFHENREGIYRTYQWLQNIHSLDKEITIHYTEDQYEYSETSYTQRDCYEYNAPTQNGDCGSLIGVYNTRLPRKIIGMHIAGSKSNFGFACPLTLEVVNEAIEKLSQTKYGISAQFCFEPPKEVDTTKDPIVPPGLFTPIGKSALKVGQAVKTALVPSLIHGKITKPIMKPALLKPKMINGVLVNPLMNGLKKCGVETANIREDIIVDAASDVFAIVSTQYDFMLHKPRFQRVLSYEEAIMGVADDSFMNSINRTTSAGFPYSLNTGGKPGKTKWLGSSQRFEFNSIDAKQLRSDVFILITKCRKGIISGVMFVDTLKDEKRDIAKVDIGKTRVFSAGPQHFIIAFRMYFLPFASWLMHNRIDNEVCVGTNPYSYDWERLSKKLRLKGDRVIAGDFGNFDGSLVASILWSIYWDIFVPWIKEYETEEQDIEDILKVTFGLWSHIVHSVHIFDDNVYMWTHSQPSGNPFTVIINCLYNSIIMRIVWTLIMEKENPRWRSMKHFRKHVSMVSYGDDNVLNISNDALPLYNQLSISEMMREIKHEYTDEEKTGNLVLSKSLDDVYFLKRKFRYCEELGRTVAPLKKEVIYEMLNWSRNTTDPSEILMDNIEVAFREIVLHGRDAYEQLRKDVTQVSKYLPRYPQILSYESLLLDIKDLNDTQYEY